MSRFAAFFGSAALTVLLALSCVGWGCAASAGAVGSGENGAISMEHKFGRYVARMQRLLDRYGYAIVAGAVLADSIGIPVLGQTVVIAGAVEASQRRMNILWLLFIVAASATLGNTGGYALGRWGGDVLLNKLSLSAGRQKHMEDIFRRRGGVVIVLGRFLDGFRQLNGIVAGVMRMPFSTFTIYNIAGAILWSCVWSLGTYYLGRDIHGVAALFAQHRWALYGITGTGLIAVLVWLMQSTKLARNSLIPRKSD